MSSRPRQPRKKNPTTKAPAMRPKGKGHARSAPKTATARAARAVGARGPSTSGPARDTLAREWQAAPRRPTISRRGNVTVVRHACQVGTYHRDVTGGPLIASYNVNMRNQQLFPWASEIANNYDQAKFVHARASLVSTAGGLATGEISVAFDPDAADSADDSRPQSIGDMTRMHASVGSASVGCNLGLDPMNITEWIYVGSNPTNVVPYHSFGTIYIGTEGVGSTELPADTTEVGVFWLEYEVEFRYPEMTTHDVAYAQLSASKSNNTTGLVQWTSPQSPGWLYSTQTSLPVEVETTEYVQPGYTVGTDDFAFRFDQPGDYRTTWDLNIRDTPTAINSFDPAGQGISDAANWVIAYVKDGVAAAETFYYEIAKKVAITYNTNGHIIRVVVELYHRVYAVGVSVMVWYKGATCIGAKYLMDLITQRTAYPALLEYSSEPRPVMYVPDVAAAQRAKLDARMGRTAGAANAGAEPKVADEASVPPGYVLMPSPSR